MTIGSNDRLTHMSSQIREALCATHPFGGLEHAPAELWMEHGINDFLEWPTCPQGTCVVALEVSTGRAVVVEGAGLRENGTFIFLPEGGRLLVEGGHGPITLPPGIYQDLEAPTELDAPVRVLPHVQWGSTHFPLNVAQVESGRRWIEAWRSTAPLPPKEELFRLCRDFYETEPVLGVLTEVIVCESWPEFASWANALATDSVVGLEIIRRLLVTALVEGRSCAKWVRAECTDTQPLARVLAAPAWRQQTETPVQGLNGVYSTIVDLSGVIPLQCGAEQAWGLETALARGQVYLPKSTTAALLEIWRNVGAFLPLRNGRALICARFTNVCGE